jgi:hypothetical protein
MLGLEDPDPTGRPLKGATVADVLAWAQMPPGSADPIEGIVDGVRIDLVALARSGHEMDDAFADMLMGYARRLWAAMQLLRWCDNRERMPVDNELPDVAKVVVRLAQQAGSAKQLLEWLANLPRMPVDEPPPSPPPEPTGDEPPASSVMTRGPDPDEPPGHA